jgi:hypothetical protein
LRAGGLLAAAGTTAGDLLVAWNLGRGDMQGTGADLTQVTALNRSTATFGVQRRAWVSTRPGMSLPGRRHEQTRNLPAGAPRRALAGLAVGPAGGGENGIRI